MMHVKTLKKEGDDLAMKGKMMGAMTMTIYLKPEDVWNGKSLLSWSVIFYLPVMVVKGFFRSRKSKNKQ